MITWPCWLSIKSNIFLAWNLALDWEKKVKQRVWGGERAALPTLPVWHSARFSHWFFCCCCFTSSLKPMKKGKNIQCQCIKLCLNNMLISLDNRPFPHSSEQRHQLEARVDKIQWFVWNCPPEPRPHFFVFVHWSVMRERSIAGLQFEYSYQKPALKMGMDFIGL